MPSVELTLRIGTAAILLLLGVVMLRDRRRIESGPFGGLMALSVAADCVVSIVGAGPGMPPWLYPLVLIAMGTPALMWIWIGAAFGDVARPTWRAALAWAVLPSIGFIELFVYWRPWMSQMDKAVALVFILLAAWRVMAGLRGDLVERRRRWRPVLAIASVVDAVGVVASHTLGVIGAGSQPSTGRTVEAAVLAALTVAFALVALRSGQLFPDLPVAAEVAPPPAVAAAAADPGTAEDDALLARLRALMEDDKIYRRDGFGLAALVAALDLPEYRLRQLINRRLGHRNFSSFVNAYRLAEAKAALADSSQAEVPILTIALDAGFQSIGPFNRAFKAETGVTPSEYRRLAETSKA